VRLRVRERERERSEVQNIKNGANEPEIHIS